MPLVLTGLSSNSIYKFIWSSCTLFILQDDYLRLKSFKPTAVLWAKLESSVPSTNTKFQYDDLFCYVAMIDNFSTHSSAPPYSCRNAGLGRTQDSTIQINQHVWFWSSWFKIDKEFERHKLTYWSCCVPVYILQRKSSQRSQKQCWEIHLSTNIGKKSNFQNQVQESRRVGATFLCIQVRTSNPRNHSTDSPIVRFRGVKEYRWKKVSLSNGNRSQWLSALYLHVNTVGRMRIDFLSNLYFESLQREDYEYRYV